jgi:hypothetical protein
MRGIADETLVLLCQAEGRGETDVATAWVAPIASSRQTAGIEVGENLVGKIPGGRRGCGFPMVIFARPEFSVFNVMGLGTYDETAPRWIELFGTQMGKVWHSDPQCRTRRLRKDRPVTDGRFRARTPVRDRHRWEFTLNVNRFRSKCECDKTWNSRI